MRAIGTGAPYRICCSAVGIAYDTFMDWKATDSEFELLVEQASAKAALRLLGKIEKQADQNFAAASWILERRFPEIFSRPEVQLNLIQQNSTTVNALSITIAPQEIREIEAVAEPVRASVRQMFDKYRPNQGNGDEQASESIYPRALNGNGNGQSADSHAFPGDNGRKDAQLGGSFIALCESGGAGPALPQ
jgi:hypothetical protein